MCIRDSGKYVLEGADAEAVLNQICANDVSVPVGRIVYTPVSYTHLL